MQFSGLLLPVVLLQSGGKLEISDIKVGHGPAARAGDILIMDYTGKLTNGKVFDSSSAHPGAPPFQFLLGAGDVIKGWDQGLVGMKEGGKRHLVIPPDLAYGSRAMGADIPANSTLAFDVELKNIARVKIVTTKAGAGVPTKLLNSIQINWILKLGDGKKIDSTYDRKAPQTLRIGDRRLPPGLNQAFIGMKVGEKRTATILPAQGFGAVQAGPIPPNSTIIADLELVKILP